MREGRPLPPLFLQHVQKRGTSKLSDTHRASQLESKKGPPAIQSRQLRARPGAKGPARGSACQTARVTIQTHTVP